MSEAMIRRPIPTGNAISYYPDACRCEEPPYPTCKCGARADTPNTHPHVTDCPCSAAPTSEKPDAR